MRKWFGDSYVGPAYFGYDCTNADDIKRPEFEAVKARLFELAEQDEVALIYVDDEGPVGLVVAYRFTSDRAYRKYRDELISLGGSLGRGVWDVFTDKYSHAYEMFFRRNEEARKEANGGRLAPGLRPRG
jgi:hypothetical protein